MYELSAELYEHRVNKGRGSKNEWIWHWSNCMMCPRIDPPLFPLRRLRVLFRRTLPPRLSVLLFLHWSLRANDLLGALARRPQYFRRASVLFLHLCLQVSDGRWYHSIRSSGRIFLISIEQILLHLSQRLNYRNSDTTKAFQTVTQTALFILGTN